MGTCRRNQLYRHGPKAAGRAPDQNIMAGPQDMGPMAEQHPVGGGQCQGIAGAFFPGEMLWPGHKLAGLNPGELGE